MSEGEKRLKYQWLQDYQELEEHLLYLKWNLNKSRLELVRWVQGDLQGIKLEKNSRAASLEEKIQFIENEIDQTEKQMEEARDIFSSFEKTDSQIIKLKYIDNYSLEDVAEELGYSHSYISKRHADISRTLTFLNSYQAKREDRRKKEAETKMNEIKLKRLSEHEQQH